MQARDRKLSLLLNSIWAVVQLVFWLQELYALSWEHVYSLATLPSIQAKLESRGAKDMNHDVA